MLKYLIFMCSLNPLQRIRALQEAEKVAYQNGLDKGYLQGFSDGYEAGKKLHDGDCHHILKEKNK